MLHHLVITTYCIDPDGRRATPARTALLHAAVLLLPALFLSACASIPSGLQGNYAAVTPTQAAAGGWDGTDVRWGGRLLKVDPRSKETCFYVLSKPLDRDTRPLDTNREQGRFIACQAGFEDPQVYAAGRSVTIVGTLQGSEQHKVGDYDYHYPKVAARSVYLWPKRLPPAPYYPPPYGPWRDPFWYGPYDPFWGPFGWPGGYYYPRSGASVYLRAPLHRPPPRRVPKRP